MNRHDYASGKVVERVLPKKKSRPKRNAAMIHPDQPMIDNMLRRGHTAVEISFYIRDRYERNSNLWLSEWQIKQYKKRFLKNP